MIEDKELKTKIRTISILLFLISFTQKCYCSTSTCGDSIMAFLLGWAAIFTDGTGIAWLANPFLFIAWYTLSRNLKVSMISSLFATIFSLSFLLFGSTMDNEGGISHAIISYEWGYKLWTSSCLIMLIGTYYLMMRHNTRAKANKAFSSDAEYL